MGHTLRAWAYVNHGRWVADCPFCPSAELLGPLPLGGERPPRAFLCAECGNASVADGLSIRIGWPRSEALAAIEALLGLRPDPINRNWERRETPADLAQENAAHGLPDLGLGGI